MEQEIIQVDNIKCGGCANSVRQALLSISGVQDVHVDTETGDVTIHFEKENRRADYIKALSRIGYPDHAVVNGVIPSIEDLIAYRKDQLEKFVQDKRGDLLEEVVENEMVEKEVIVGFPREEILKISKDKETDLIFIIRT